MHFVKMHGAKNDYIFVDVFEQTVPDDLPLLARVVSDRHAGIGADGLVVIEPSDSGSADAKMRMWNADGSEAQMCGNALRCVVRYLRDQNRVTETARIETGHGILTGSAVDDSGGVRVEMGRPILDAAKIPTTLPGDPPLNVPLNVRLFGEERTFVVSSVSMGNPHCVIFDAELTDETVLGFGPKIETASDFPERTNVEFVRVNSRSRVEVRVWERGSGETMACGTGACAVVVAGVLTERLDRICDVELPGGTLQIDWTQEVIHVIGPTCVVFEGDWRIEE